MKYVYKLNISPKEAQEKLKRSIRPLNVGLRFIEEVFILEKNVAYGKVKNNKFEIVVRTTGEASGKFALRKKSDTFHLRHLFGRVDSVDGQTVISFAFRSSILNVLILAAFVYVCMSCFDLLLKIATKGLSFFEIISFAIIATFLHIVETAVYRKQSEEAMLDFISKTFDLNINADKTDLD